MSVYYIKNESIDNFSENKRLEYMGIEDKVLTAEEMKEQFKEELYKDTTIFISDSIFIGYPIRDNGTIRPATRIELVKMGLQQLEDGEYISDDEIIKVESPSWQYLWNAEQKKWIPDENKLNSGDFIEGDIIKHTSYDESLGYFIPVWNKEENVWEESATDEEKKAEYKRMIDTFKAEILKQGFNYKGHQQKCREKDVALLGNTISALNDINIFTKDKERENINWAFNDNDIVPMKEIELRRLRVAGAEFINTVYMIEAELKADEINLNLTDKDFIEKINSVSKMKCYFDSIQEDSV